MREHAAVPGRTSPPSFGAPARPFDAPAGARPPAGVPGHDFGRIDVRPADAVQRRAAPPSFAAAPAAGDAVRRAARQGVATPAAALPFAERIQRSFGRHDLTRVRAHVGLAASRSAGAMGASAYATGGHVVFATRPDLHTAAHEAAHVVQQRAGVRPPGGVGREGDPWERHADAVAGRVAAGGSAEALLDRVAGAPAAAGPSAAAPGAAVQMQGGGRASNANRYRESGKLNQRIRKQERKQASKRAAQPERPRLTPAQRRRQAEERARRQAERQRQVRERERQAAQKKEWQKTYMGLSNRNAWQEIIDARDHETGPKTYDRGLHAPEDWEDLGYESREEAVAEHAEPGYLKSAMNARRYVAGRMGERVDADFLEQVHAVAAAHKREGEGYHGGYRGAEDTESSVSFHATDDGGEDYERGAPAEALQQLEPGVTRAFAVDPVDEDSHEFGNLSEREQEMGGRMVDTQGEHGNLHLHFLPKPRDQVKGHVNTILDDYYPGLGQIQPGAEDEQDQRLGLVARTHRRLENLHPFIDANTRTHRLVLHKMLVENGMTPAVLDNPLQVHLQSDEEWAGTLRAGMQKWQEARREQDEG